MDAAIEVANLSCRYRRGADVVRDLTFAVRPGSISALLGPNGAGKTTTIRVLMNMIRPAGGTARVLGVETTRLGPRERADRLRLREPEAAALDDSRAVAVVLPSVLSHVGRAFQPIADRRVPPAAADDARSSVARDADQGGAGASLAFRPRVLVLDEPFSGLDPVMRDDLVRRRPADGGAGAVDRPHLLAGPRRSRAPGGRRRVSRRRPSGAGRIVRVAPGEVPGDRRHASCARTSGKWRRGFCLRSSSGGPP